MSITKKEIYTTHICMDDITENTAAILVDLSDTTNFPHVKSDGDIYLMGYQVSLSPDTNYKGGVGLGFLKNVNGSNGDFHTVFCWQFQGQASGNVNDGEWFGREMAIRCKSDYFLVSGNLNDASFQTDLAIPSPYDITDPYTTVSGDGDIAIKITRTAGSIYVGVTIHYVVA